MRYLITGGCGFLGSNLAQEVLARGEELLILDNLSRKGSEINLEWLKKQDDFLFFNLDIRNRESLEHIFKTYQPDVVFHLAGQVAMTTSIINPLEDFEINTLGTLNVLDSIRKFSEHTIIVYSSTNKVYGDLEWVKYTEGEKRYIANDYREGFDETIPLSFSSPYGCSKGSADQYLLDYSKIFGIKTVVFRHSSMYGARQFSTADQGWVGWFCQQALLKRENKSQPPFTICGNGKQVRDVLHAEDMKKLYFAAIACIEQAKGEAFNIGGSINNSLSLLELFDLFEELLNIKLDFEQLLPRQADQKIFVANVSKAKKLLNWSPTVTAPEGIEQMLTYTCS